MTANPKSLLEPELNETAAVTLVSIGERIRERRKARKLTLQQLAEGSGLSPSMLSLVERGRTSPSIGSLIVISETLGVTMSELVDPRPQPQSFVVRGRDAKVVVGANNVARKVLLEDTLHHVTVAINEYGSGTASNDVPLTHEGFEYGLVLEGQLTVEIDGVAHVLNTGDFISYPSRLPHRISNPGKTTARTAWFNLDEK